jgi:hypothetical protein
MNMTSGILFFCTKEEESLVWEFLRKGDIASLLINPFDLNGVMPIDFNIIPDWPEPLAIYFHFRQAGSIQWHEKKPMIDSSQHDALVNSLLAQQTWSEFNFQQGSSILDMERSPLQIYFRGVIENGQIGPSSLTCPPSNMGEISNEYGRWVERSRSWIRRNSVRVHDWRNQSNVLHNPLKILSSVYAFPKAKEEIDLNPEKYAILIK